MRLLLPTITLLLPLPYVLSAQSWEVGASAGYGVFRDVNVTAGTASGKAGFSSGIAFGGVFANDMHRLVGGEARYTFRSDDLRVSSGAVTAKMRGQSHALHYDVLVHGASKESWVRPFAAVGAGVKIYRGTGPEPAIQPLSNLVVLTHTTEAQPLISLGGGVKFSMSRRMLLRLDFRDYVTPLPNNLLATRGGNKIGNWIHDFVFMVGVSTVF
jgi:hypothetical protein